MPQVTFLPSDITVDVSEGESILDTALDNEIELNHKCGGNCVCSTCHVVIESGFESLDAVRGNEQEMLDELEEPQPTSRLACQTVVVGDLVIRIPPPESD